MATRTEQGGANKHEGATSHQPDPVIEAYKRDIDRTLLRENLKLTVEERFFKLSKSQQFATELQKAGSASASWRISNPSFDSWRTHKPLRDLTDCSHQGT